jgi:hypothetical protein
MYIVGSVIGLGLVIGALILYFSPFGLGALFGYGLDKVSSNALGFVALKAMIASSVFLLAFAILRWFGLCDWRGQMVVFGYAGFTMERVLHASTILHRSVWIGVVLGSVCIILGIWNVYSQPTGDGISAWVRLLYGDRNRALWRAEQQSADRL